MAVVQISRIQLRRGLQQDLPQLATAEMAWSIDTRQLYIGNGTLSEGAPTTGVTEILTTYSVISYTSNVAAIASNVAILQQQVAALGGTPTSVTLGAGSSGIIAAITANNATLTYTISQGTKQRIGTLKLVRFAGTSVVSYDEEYDEANGTTDLIFSANADTTRANLLYTTTTSTSLRYTLSSI
jgi:hypothetical protein